MTTQDEDQPVARRVSLRRSRGFGGGVSTRSESLRADTEGDDDVIDPDTVHREIVNSARRRPPPPRATLPAPSAAGFSPIPGNEYGDEQIPPPPNPADRMGQVAQAGSAAYAIEYRLTMLHRLLMRNVPLDQIALQLGVSISTVEKDRVKLKERFRRHARELDINEIVGTQMGVYSEIAGVAMRLSSDNSVPVPMKLAALRTTLAAEADRTRFLNSAGVFDVLRYRKAEDGTDVSDVQMLMESTENMLAMIMNDEAEPEPPRPAPRRGRTPPAARGGFAPLSMDDTDASNSRTENVEL